MRTEELVEMLMCCYSDTDVKIKSLEDKEIECIEFDDQQNIAYIVTK